MTRREMFEKVATELFIRMASHTTQLPPDASDEKSDAALEWARAGAQHALIAASAFMAEYDCVADVVATVDSTTERGTL